MRRSKPLHCQRRALPCTLKVEIILRQNGCCADCGAHLTIGGFVFDHRPPLALRDVGEDANDPQCLAAICTKCDADKTPRDLKEIARVKRRGPTYNQTLERQRRLLGTAHPTSIEPCRLEPFARNERETGPERHGWPSSYEALMRRADERWALEEAGLGSWPPFSKSDLT